MSVFGTHVNRRTASGLTFEHESSFLTFSQEIVKYPELCTVRLFRSCECTQTLFLPVYEMQKTRKIKTMVLALSSMIPTINDFIFDGIVDLVQIFIILAEFKRFGHFCPHLG